MEITIIARQTGDTVLTVLRRDLGVSASLCARLRQKEGGILCNGAPVHTTAVLHAGDVLFVNVEEEAPAVPPIAMPLDILWEDEFFLAVNKTAGLAVHPSSLPEDQPTLSNGVVAYLGPKSGFHPINRLDRGTSGVMLIAKSGYGHALCQKLLHTENFQREYLGVCAGTPAALQGAIDAPIGRDESSLLRRRVTPDGAPARTNYTVLSAAGDAALLRLCPRTGRTHQIRVHLASIGHPLLGDWLYGTEDRALIARPALHARALRLRHPVTGAEIRVTAPLPADFQNLLDRKCLNENRIEACL